MAYNVLNVLNTTLIPLLQCSLFTSCLNPQTDKTEPFSALSGQGDGQFVREIIRICVSNLCYQLIDNKFNTVSLKSLYLLNVN